MKKKSILTLFFIALISSCTFISCGFNNDNKADMKKAGENVKEDAGNLEEDMKNTAENVGETIKYTAMNFKDDVINAGRELKDAIKNNKKDYFHGNETDYMVGKDYIRVYEYDDSNKIESDIKRISNDGLTIDGSSEKYNTKPYYYKKGNTLFVYEGNDPNYISTFKDLLGNPLR